MATVQGILQVKGSSVVSIGAHRTVLDAARAMNHHRIGAIVVMEGEYVRGILSERDIMVRVVAAHRDPAEVIVEDVMSSPVVCCRPEAGLDEVRDVMVQNCIRHVPVVDGRERLKGIVASDDVLTRRISEREEHIDALCTYIHGPAIHVGREH